MAATTKVSALIAAATGCIPEEPRTPSIAPSLTFSEESEDQEEQLPVEPLRRRRASTRLIAQNSADIQRITGESTAQLIERCCGGGCCMKAGVKKAGVEYESIPLPDNHAFKSLALRIGDCPTLLTKITDLPEQTVFFEPPRRSSPAPSTADSGVSVGADASPTTPPADKVASLALEDVNTKIQPPNYVQPHPPHHVFAARIDSTRELTKPGAEKRTYHFDIDISSYPEEDGTDFKVGGAIGVMAPNDPAMVDEIFDALMVPRFVRDKPVLMKTSRGRWPTVWGEDEPRELLTTRRDLLTWCSDIQSYPPTKNLLRILAEYAADENEKKLLMYLCAAEGQGVFCDFRTGPHVSLFQLLSAFPSSHPPLDLLLSVLQPLMPRFYSLSNDPHDSYKTRDGKVHRLVEIAVTVHESADWLHGTRTGIGSGFFERQAQKFLAAQKAGESSPEFYVPMFKAHGQPLAKQREVRNQADLVWYIANTVDGRVFVCGSSKGMGEGVEDALVDVAMSKGNLEREEARKYWDLKREAGQYIAETW
ncbi:FAD binding domain-containing protein [Verticillium alfalfae VaMs.102]|uniref:FAD binding domain-containing protein n=1 Tax=Verticillium alfalfae (strain VaMs.102 / ATCC MYA-4576 / FGSC 10136) TaxID=526221 RepID=C9SXE0_VERA1|nr:FAD binding domain-containing protein [Verticillium alfalfae VaMs.102]EEY23330.1 FAD binding domain-containing protein [Verticillium alfalfae VaMs.102]